MEQVQWQYKTQLKSYFALLAERLPFTHALSQETKRTSELWDLKV
jgi:hypothetical protein